MEVRKIIIGNIPTIIWGRKSDKVYIHVHGKMSCKEYAEDFAKIAELRGYQTISFDLPKHGERMAENYRCDIWNGMHDLMEISDFAFLNWVEVALFACSIGAYFSLNVYAEKSFSKALFQSPILNMKQLIEQMFVWFDITEERLRIEKEIATPIELLSWDYYQYVNEHPVSVWDVPTKILYGSKDNLQSIEVVEEFSKTNNCQLHISQNSEHPFMGIDDAEKVSRWLEESI